MSQSQVMQFELQHLQNLHIATCTLMNRFINGHHCPKLAHSIVHKLGQLLSSSQLVSVQIAANQEMYLQLLEHWQKVTHQLLEQQMLEQQTVKQKMAVQYH